MVSPPKASSISSMVQLVRPPATSALATAVSISKPLEEGRAAILTSTHMPGTGWYDDSIQALRLLPAEKNVPDVFVFRLYMICPCLSTAVTCF